MSTKKRRLLQQCSNCDTPLLNGENFCPNCGQENNSKQVSVRLLIDDFFKDYIAFDSKIFRSIRPLLFAPGRMTQAYLDGKRQMFVPPIRLFLFLSFLYFGSSLLFDQTPVETTLTISGDDASDQILPKFRQNFQYMVFFFTPLQALILMPFFRSKRRRFYINYLVYTLHTFSFFFVLGIVHLLISSILGQFEEEFIWIELGYRLVLLIYLIYYSIVSLKRVFEKRFNILRYLGTIIVSLVIFLAVMFGALILIAELYGTSFFQ